MKDGMITMNQKLVDKVRYEYEIFLVTMLGGSRENIYANSEQITIKRKISQNIENAMASVTEAQSHLLLCEPNLLDSIYLHIKEQAPKEGDAVFTMQEYMKKQQLERKSNEL